MEQNEINIPETCDDCPLWDDDRQQCHYDYLFNSGCYYATIDELKD